MSLLIALLACAPVSPYSDSTSNDTSDWLTHGVPVEPTEFECDTVIDGAVVPFPEGVWGVDLVYVGYTEEFIEPTDNWSLGNETVIISFDGDCFGVVEWNP